MLLLLLHRQEKPEIGFLVLRIPRVKSQKKGASNRRKIHSRIVTLFFLALIFCYNNKNNLGGIAKKRGTSYGGIDRASWTQEFGGTRGGCSLLVESKLAEVGCCRWSGQKGIICRRRRSLSRFISTTSQLYAAGKRKEILPRFLDLRSGNLDLTFPGGPTTTRLSFQPFAKAPISPRPLWQMILKVRSHSAPNCSKKLSWKNTIEYGFFSNPESLFSTVRRRHGVRITYTMI